MCLGQWEEEILQVVGEGFGPGSPYPHPISINGGAMTVSPTSTRDAFMPRLSHQLSQTTNEVNV